jgi:tRNA guanosine-2'-O-methyltransferase
VREDLRHAMAKDSVTIKNEDLAVDQHHSEARIGERTCSQDALNFQKKITPHGEPASSNTVSDDVSRMIFGM